VIYLKGSGHDSIVTRAANDTGAPFWGFQLTEAMPQIGDIVGKWREVAIQRSRVSGRTPWPRGRSRGKGERELRSTQMPGLIEARHP
jgi:hypothetical protein